MPSLVELKQQVRDIAQKGLDIAEATDIPISKRNGQLNRIDAQLKPLLEEIKSLEFVEERKKSLGFDPSFAGSAWGGGFGYGAEQLRTKAPSIALSDDQLHGMFAAAKSMAPFRAELKDATADTTATGYLPNVLAPGVVERRHEVRLLERFPTAPMAGPVVEFIRHATTSGSAATVAPGALKPALIMTPDTVTAHARKIAAFTSTTTELLQDFDAWAAYVRNELTRAVIDAENTQILSGDGTGENLLGLLATTGLLTRDAAADHTADATNTGIDTIERAIADLRTGPSLVDADTIVMHPNTWSKLRRTKDSQGRYLVNPDPTAVEAAALFGIGVYTTTTIAAGTAVVANLAAAATVFVRQGIALETTNSHSDYFQRNQLAYVAEERIALAVQRPSAVVQVTNL